MNKQRKESLITGTLFLLAGIMFIISSIIGADNNFVYISLGCCFITISIVFYTQDKNKKDNKSNKETK